MISIMMAVVLMMGMTVAMPQCTHAEMLDTEQKNAIAMLNYLTVLTQETNASKNSRMFMEQAYSSLINNTYPNSVDSRTLNQMTGLLDTMERYRMLSVKRDRLQFIYEQNQAQAIRAAMPNPVALLSSVHSLTPARLVASIVYMAVDSYTSYTAYTAEAELQALKDGWELDDEIKRLTGFSWVIDIIDHFSKFLISVPVKNNNGINILYCIKEFINYVGKPKEFQSDNGSEYKNNLIKNFLDDNNIIHIFSSPRHPKSN